MCAHQVLTVYLWHHLICPLSSSPGLTVYNDNADITCPTIYHAEARCVDLTNSVPVIRTPPKRLAKSREAALEARQKTAFHGQTHCCSSIILLHPLSLTNPTNQPGTPYHELEIDLSDSFMNKMATVTHHKHVSYFDKRRLFFLLGGLLGGTSITLASNISKAPRSSPGMALRHSRVRHDRCPLPLRPFFPSNSRPSLRFSRHPASHVRQRRQRFQLLHICHLGQPHRFQHTPRLDDQSRF